MGLVIKGATSGQVTVDGPASAGTNTLTIPALTGTANIVGSSFSAYQSSQQTGISNGVNTKINFQTEEWDLNSDYDTSNSRFTPTVAGYYQITIGCQGGTSRSGNGTSALFIFKNGSKFKDMVMNEGHTNQVTWGIHTGIVAVNGSSDYIEAYVNADGMPSTFNLNSNTDNHRTFFQGIFIRGL